MNVFRNEKNILEYMHFTCVIIGNNQVKTWNGQIELSSNEGAMWIRLRFSKSREYYDLYNPFFIFPEPS